MALRAGYYGIKNALLKKLEALTNAVVIKSIGEGLELSAAGELSNTSTGGVDYSTVEQDTGKKWIDGRSIFCRTFDVSTDGTELEVGNAQWVNSGISSEGIDSVIDTACFNNSGSCYFLMAALTAHAGNVSLLACRAGTGSALAHYVTLFYLKPATANTNKKSTKKTAKADTEKEGE